MPYNFNTISDISTNETYSYRLQQNKKHSFFWQSSSGTDGTETVDLDNKKSKNIICRRVTETIGTNKYKQKIFKTVLLLWVS